MARANPFLRDQTALEAEYRLDRLVGEVRSALRILEGNQPGAIRDETAVLALKVGLSQLDLLGDDWRERLDLALADLRRPDPDYPWAAALGAYVPEDAVRDQPDPV